MARELGFKKIVQDKVKSIEQMVKDKARKKAESKARKAMARIDDERTITLCVNKRKLVKWLK